jgi:hypothetical protein
VLGEEELKEILDPAKMTEPRETSE